VERQDNLSLHLDANDARANKTPAGQAGERRVTNEISWDKT